MVTMFGLLTKRQAISRNRKVVSIIDGENLDNWRQLPLELATPNRHCNHYLCLLKQSYSAIKKKLRGKTKAIFIWHPKEMEDVKLIDDENNGITDDELFIVGAFVKTLKHVSFYIRNEYPQRFFVRNHILDI